MNATDRLRLAAKTLRTAASGDVSPGPWTVAEAHGRDFTGEGWSYIAVTTPDGAEVAATAYDGRRGDSIDPLADAALIALMANPPLAEAIADWLEDIAADKDAGLGSIHPRALDVTNLILGSDQ